MPNVYLRFVTEPGFTSWAIREFSWSDYSHIDFVLANGNFLGARLSGGVAVREHDYLIPSKYRYAFVEVRSVKSVIGWATSQVGKPYDWRAILGFLPREDWHEPGHWFCSELVAQAFNLKDTVIVDNQMDRITPQSVLESPRVHKIDGIPDFIRDLGWTF